MRISQTLVVLLFVFASLSQGMTNASAAPFPVLDVSALTREAHLITVGQIVSVREEERGNYEIGGQLISARRMVASLNVSRVLKGEADGEVLFRFFLTDQFDDGYPELGVEQFGMFFLRSTPEGHVPASLYHPFVNVTQTRCAAEGTHLARVVAELECVLNSPATIRERIATIWALRTVQTAETSSVLRRAARELPSPLNLLAAGMLLSRNDTSVLPLIEQAIQHSPIVALRDEGYSSEMNLGAWLGEIRDTTAIPTLARLIENPDIVVRRGAAQALRNIRTEAVIEPLSRALYDDDWEVRWLAVMGLAGIAGADDEGNSWYPSHDEFRQNEQRYLDHWREWVRNR